MVVLFSSPDNTGHSAHGSIHSSTHGNTTGTSSAKEIEILNPLKIPRFQYDLPIAQRIHLDRSGDPTQIEMIARETEQFMGVIDDQKQPLLTTTWGWTYAPLNPNDEIAPTRFPGPTLVVATDRPIQVHWNNELNEFSLTEGRFLEENGHANPDPRLHSAPLDPEDKAMVIHLHGGHTDSQYDGYPTAYYAQKNDTGYAVSGPDFETDQYIYDNSQPAGFLWYHDHVMGYTGANVYSGLAGLYMVTDDNERQMIAEGIVPDQDHTLELALMDRKFNPQGQLIYHPCGEFTPAPHEGSETIMCEINQEFPHGDEFWGNVNTVNGMAWPKVNVAPEKLRLRILNGADSRTYVIRFGDGSRDANKSLPFTVIGTDGGMQPRERIVSVPNLTQHEIVLSPAERVDIVLDLRQVDLSQYPDGRIVMENWGGDIPFKGFFKPDEIDENGLPLDRRNDRVDDDYQLYNNNGADNGYVANMTNLTTTGQIMAFDLKDQPQARAQAADDRAEQVTPVISEFNHAMDLANWDPETKSLLDEWQSQDKAIIRELGLFRLDDSEDLNLLMLGSIDRNCLEISGDPQQKETMLNSEACQSSGTHFFDDEISEYIEEGSVEIWAVYNATVSAHPVHVHLVQFRALGRDNFSGHFVNDKPQAMMEHGGMTMPVKGGHLYLETLANPFADSVIIPPAWERGPKDTLRALPGQVTYFIAKYDKSGVYVWHCHMLSHEDYDMMRPFEVISASRN